MNRRRRDGEIGRNAREERIELRRIEADLPLPQVVGDREAEPREEVRAETVAERLRLPASVTGLFRLLEIVLNRAGVDRQQPELPGRRLRGGVARGWLQLGFEVLREPEADRLLR